MLRSIIDWWAEQSGWLRYGIPIISIGISTALWLLEGRVWVYGWAVGAALLLFSGKSQSEKNGYNF